MLVITATEIIINNSIKAEQRTWKKDVRLAKNIYKYISNVRNAYVLILNLPVKNRLLEYI